MSQVCWERQALACSCGHSCTIEKFELPSTYLEHALQLSYYELPLKVRYHSYRRTWGRGPTRSRFGVQAGDSPLLSWGSLKLLCYKNVCQNACLRFPNPTGPPFAPPLGSQGQGRGNQIMFGVVPYNLAFNNSLSMWVTMPPEGHGPQVLPDQDLGSKKVTCSPTKLGVP